MNRALGAGPAVEALRSKTHGEDGAVQPSGQYRLLQRIEDHALAGAVECGLRRRHKADWFATDSGENDDRYYREKPAMGYKSLEQRRMGYI